jgi:hypothetical protein
MDIRVLNPKGKKYLGPFARYEAIVPPLRNC